MCPGANGGSRSNDVSVGDVGISPFSIVARLGAVGFAVGPYNIKNCLHTILFKLFTLHLHSMSTNITSLVHVLRYIRVQ